MTVGADLHALRKRRGLTLDELSALCGVSRDDLGLYERGAMTPRPETVQKIAQALEVPITVIREGMGWTAPEPSEAWETAGDDHLLRRGLLENLRESYGPDFSLSEGEIRALLDSVKASIPALIEHMKDTRSETEINANILAELNLLPGDGGEDQVRRYALTDSQWAQIQPLLPPESAGRGRAFKSNRLMLDGILFQLRTGTAWSSLPKYFGRPRCVADRLRLWKRTGVWAQVEQALVDFGLLDEKEDAAKSQDPPETGRVPV